MGSCFITNGRVIDPSSDLDSKINLLVKDGKIVELTHAKQVDDSVRVIDAKGSIVSPGFIDMHTHLREPGFEYKEDIASGTRAAAAGGYTTICCMPNTKPVNDTQAVTEYIINRAREAGVIDVIPVGAISRGLEGLGLADIGDMAAAGVKAISDDGRPVMNSTLMRRAMEYSKAFGVFVISHCEDLNLSSGGVMHEGQVATELGLRGIPSVAEESMAARDIMLARMTGSRLHIAHASTAGTLSLVRQAKRDGIAVSVEVTPHNLTLTHESCSDYDPNTKMNPPLRTEEDKNELIKGLADGTIDVIATDHAPHNIVEKETGFEEAAFGIVGLETALPIILKLVHDKKITISRMIELMSCASAKLLGLNDRGSLVKGKMADITIFDPDAAWTVNSSKFASKSHNSPFNGLRVIGKVKFTIKNGEVVFGH